MNMGNFNCYICEGETDVKKGIMGSAAATMEVCNSCNSDLTVIQEQIKNIPNRKLPFNKSGNIFNNKKKDEEALWRCSVELKRSLSKDEEIKDFLSIDNGTFAATSGMIVLTSKKLIGFSFTTSGVAGVKIRNLVTDFNLDLKDVVNIKFENSFQGEKILLESTSRSVETEEAFKKLFTSDRNGSNHFKSSLVKQKGLIAESKNSSMESPSKSSDSLENLKKLKDLLDAGIITQEDFEKKKNEILGGL